MLDLTWRYCDTLSLSDTTCQIGSSALNWFHRCHSSRSQLNRWSLMVGSIHRRQNKVSHCEVALWTHQDAPSISTINPTSVMPSVGGRNLQTYPIQPHHPHISILMWAPLDEITTPPTSRKDWDLGAGWGGGFNTESVESVAGFECFVHLQ